MDTIHARLRELELLMNAAAEDFRRDFDLELKALGIESEEAEGAALEARELLEDYAASTAARTLFELDLGEDAVDGRLIVECERLAEPNSEGRYYYERSRTGPEYEVRRVLYRAAPAGSSEVELDGADRTIAERFAARALPELA